MTGFLHEREFSRKSFLKGGGALVVGLALAPAAQAFNDPKAASPSHTGAVAGPPTRSTPGWRSIRTTRPRSIRVASTSARGHRTAS
jgi:hypothetical protein